MKWKWIAFGLVLVGLGALVKIANTPPPALSVEEQAREVKFRAASGGALTLRQQMRDPESFRVASAIVTPDKSVCYRYRSHNGFGGMSDGRAMIYAGMLLSKEDAAFDKVWQKECAGVVGEQTADEVMAGLRQYDKLHSY